MDTLHEPYAVLGVPATASAAEIRRAYRRRLRQVHPDTGTADAAEFDALLAAYRVVGNAARRRVYDTECIRLAASLLTNHPAGPFTMGDTS